MLKNALFLLFAMIASLSVYLMISGIFYLYYQKQHAQNLTEKMARKWLRYMFKLTRSNITVEGRENYHSHKNYLIVANHQSTFDIPIMGFLDLPFSFISKETYFKWPLVGLAMKAAGYISINRSDRSQYTQALHVAAHQISHLKRSVMLFPEGTRSMDGTIKPFKGGALKIATLCETDVEVLPLSIYGTKDMMPKKAFRVKRAHVVLKIAPPICIPHDYKAYSPEKKNALLKQIENTIKANYDACQKKLLA